MFVSALVLAEGLGQRSHALDEAKLAQGRGSPTSGYDCRLRRGNVLVGQRIRRVGSGGQAAIGIEQRDGHESIEHGRISAFALAVEETRSRGESVRGQLALEVSQ